MEKSILKNCEKHGETKFFLRTDKEYYRCAKCASDAVSKRRRKLKQMAVEYKGGVCEKCSYNKSIWALDFHHKDPTQKDFGIAKSGHTKSWERIKKEIDKCFLLCKNCHCEVHEEICSNSPVA